MRESRDEPVCKSYRPVHLIHRIQSRKVWDSKQIEIAVAASIYNDGRIVLQSEEGDSFEGWTHNLPASSGLGHRTVMRAYWLPKLHVLSVNGSMLYISTTRTSCVYG